MSTTHQPILSRLRAALPRRAGAIVVLAVMLAGMQLALQTHLIEHDLLPSNHAVCEQCVVAKGATPPPAAVGVATPQSSLAPFLLAAPHALRSLAPVSARNRGPPAVA